MYAALPRPLARRTVAVRWRSGGSSPQPCSRRGSDGTGRTRSARSGAPSRSLGGRCCSDRSRRPPSHRGPWRAAAATARCPCAECRAAPRPAGGPDEPPRSRALAAGDAPLQRRTPRRTLLAQPHQLIAPNRERDRHLIATRLLIPSDLRDAPHHHAERLSARERRVLWELFERDPLLAEAWVLKEAFSQSTARATKTTPSSDSTRSCRRRARLTTSVRLVRQRHPELADRTARLLRGTHHQRHRRGRHQQGQSHQTPRAYALPTFTSFRKRIVIACG